MAFRGRGRGRGGGWWPGSTIGGGRAFSDDDFALFPKIEGLPPMRDLTDEEKFLIDRKRHFASWCKNSPYFIKDRSLSHDTLAPDVEMYSDTKAKETVRRATLLDSLILTPSNFPMELIEGQAQRDKKRSSAHRVKAKKDLHHMDSLLAKLKDDGKDEADEDEEAEEGDKKRKKGDGDEDEDEENDNVEEEEDDEAIGADDYTENFGFDDDEDFLDGEDDGGNDEPTYE